MTTQPDEPVTIQAAGYTFTYTSHAERERALRLAEAVRGSLWPRFSTYGQETVTAEARDWLRAAERLGILPTLDELVLVLDALDVAAQAKLDAVADCLDCPLGGACDACQSRTDTAGRYATTEARLRAGCADVLLYQARQAATPPQPAQPAPLPTWALIAPDGTLTFHPGAETPEVERLVGGRFGALDRATLDGPVRVLASDVGHVYPADFLDNPIARRVIGSLSRGRVVQPWRGHVAITQYEQDPETRELLWPGPMDGSLIRLIKDQVAASGGRDAEPGGPWLERLHPDPSEGLPQ